MIYIDVEFSNFENPKLISIGAIKSNGEKFYSEVENIPSNCSQFVIERVIPLLSGIKNKDILVDFLEFIGNEDIVSDNPEHDFRVLPEIKNKIIHCRWTNEMRSKADGWFKNNPPHHALNDAIGLMIACSLNVDYPC